MADWPYILISWLFAVDLFLNNFEPALLSVLSQFQSESNAECESTRALPRQSINFQFIATMVFILKKKLIFKVLHPHIHAYPP
jgi:hypothetical protein